jgi:hypothetical protein
MVHMAGSDELEAGSRIQVITHQLIIDAAVQVLPCTAAAQLASTAVMCARSMQPAAWQHFFWGFKWRHTHPLLH